MSNSVKLYAVFLGDHYYYPARGIKDYKDSFDTIDEAKSYISKMVFDWFQIVDTITFKVVEET